LAPNQLSSKNAPDSSILRDGVTRDPSATPERERVIRLQDCHRGTGWLLAAAG